MLRFRVRPCTSSCCVRSPETNDSVSARSSASSPSAWSTSPPRSRRRGHRVTIADLRFSGSVEQQLRRTRPDLVGIAGMHALETDEVLALARRGSSARARTCRSSSAATPLPRIRSRSCPADVDAVVLDDGERALPEIVDAIEKRRPLSEVPGIAVGDQSGGVRRTEANPDAFELDDVPLPARRLVDGWRRQYACLAHRPTWLIETARGCPFRCSFCSIWQLHARSVRERSIESVCQDFASCGDEIFVADDLFWYHPSRSRALAMELRRRGIRKKWILVQSRVDLVARHADLLEAWRPIARDFDIFFGLEAATNEGLTGLVKDATVDQTAAGHRGARGRCGTASPGTS